MGLSVSGRRVLLTGASGGIGGAIAQALHARGAVLVLSGRRADALDRLRADLRERVEVQPCDLSEAGAPAELAARAGAVDVLVANAGLPAAGRLESFTPEEIDRSLSVNLRAPIQLAHSLAPAMVARGSGHLVFMSSLSGKVAAAGGAIYSATKFGVRGFAFALREDLRGTGVGVTTVFPGFVSEAGFFAAADVHLPPGIGLRSPQQVAAAVLRGIERDRAELDVAPLVMRAGGWLAGAAPLAVAAITRRLGGGRVADGLAEAHRERR